MAFRSRPSSSHRPGLRANAGSMHEGDDLQTSMCPGYPENSASRLRHPNKPCRLPSPGQAIHGSRGYKQLLAHDTGHCWLQEDRQWRAARFNTVVSSLEKSRITQDETAALLGDFIAISTGSSAEPARSNPSLNARRIHLL